MSMFSKTSLLQVKSEERKQKQQLFMAFFSQRRLFEFESLAHLVLVKFRAVRVCI